MINFNKYDNIRTPKIESFTTIEQWFNLIKSSEYSDSITAARKFDKSNPFYIGIKTILPAITYNFIFKDNKENKNITGATGLLYIDIDTDGFDIKSLDTNKVFAYYKSFGGKGYSILVKVDGLTLDNYKATYEIICNELGIESLYDKDAKKATQFNVLSFDPNIFINYDSITFSSIDKILDNDFTPISQVIKKRETYTYDLGEKINNDKYRIRFDNLNEIDIPDDVDHIVNWEGYDYVKCWLPIRKVIEGRKRLILSYTNNLIWLNPLLNKKGTFNLLQKINSLIFFTPLKDNILIGIIDSIFKYKEEGTLEPKYYWKKRKVVYKESAGLNKNEKFKILLTELAKKKTGESKVKIYTVLENWDFNVEGKITQFKVITISRMNKKTVEKYWCEFKEYIAELNAQFQGKPAVTSKENKNAIEYMKTEYNEAVAALTGSLNMSEAHMEETGAYTFGNTDYTVEMEGIKIWNNLTAKLTTQQSNRLCQELLENLLNKRVNIFELIISDARVKVFTNTTVEPNFIQVQLKDLPAELTPVTIEKLPDMQSMIDELIKVPEACIDVQYNDTDIELDEEFMKGIEITFATLESD